MSRTILSLLVLLILLGVSSVLAPAALAEPVDESGGETAVILMQDDGAQDQPAEEDSSALPEGLSRIFASLGLYIVTMFTMAIGTEIMVDVFKLIVGLRSKPTAKETLKEYERMLPGTLDSLGIGAEARAHLENQVSALKGILQPVIQVETAVVALKQKDFDAALATFHKDNPQTELVTAAAEVLKRQVDTAVAKLGSATAFGSFIPDALIQTINAQIDELAANTAAITVNELYQKGVALLTGELADPITAWTEAQVSHLQTLSYQQAQLIYQRDILPQIKNAGLSENLQKTITIQVEDFLENIRRSHEAYQYLEAMNKMLLEVEKQRDELAAIWRKLLGRLAKAVESRLPWLKLTRPKLDPTIDAPENAAMKLLEIERRDKKESGDRVQQLRLVSVLVGILLAYALQIDSADLLGDLLPPNANFLSVILITGDSMLLAWMGRVFTFDPHALTAGIVLTGLAASAGSGFWHDQLSRLQNVQRTVESAYKAVQPVVAQIQTSQNEGKG